jgi:capsular polysaccharide biosynthesis protein
MQTLDVYRALWRHKVFICVLTALLGAAAWVLVSRQTKIYQATSLVRIQQRITTPTEAYGAIQTGQLLAETYAQIVPADTVRRRIFALVKNEIPTDTGQISIGAAPVQRLDLLQISAKGPDPVQAALVANAAPRALAAFIRETGTSRDQIVPIDRASVPTKAVSPRIKLDLALAILLGLIVNSALALVLELVGDRVRQPEELEDLFGLPVLATIPSVKLRSAPADRTGSSTVAFINDLGSRSTTRRAGGRNVT